MADVNPYEAPRADLEPGLAPAAASGVLASRAQRLGGAMIDAFLEFGAHAVIYLGLSKREVMSAGGNFLKLYLQLGIWGHLTGAVVVSLLLAQWFFTTTRGQTIGKMVARSRMVRINGAPLGFLHGVVIRNWILAAPSLLLSVFGIGIDGPLAWAFTAVAILDVLFIFGHGKRCLHDLMANTKVIDLMPPARTA
jgi:uncharacterized RDD family membrane protein YckC